MARRGSTTAAKRLARLQERLAVVRRARAGEGGPVVVYADDEQAVREYVKRREREGAELVVVVRSLAVRPEGEPASWT